MIVEASAAAVASEVTAEVSKEVAKEAVKEATKEATKEFGNKVAEKAVDIGKRIDTSKASEQVATNKPDITKRVPVTSEISNNDISSTIKEYVDDLKSKTSSSNDMHYQLENTDDFHNSEPDLKLNDEKVNPINENEAKNTCQIDEGRKEDITDNNERRKEISETKDIPNICDNQYNTTKLEGNSDEVHEGLSADEKNKIKMETGWSDKIVDSIENMDQYEKLKTADLIEIDINGKKCLVKENIDLNFEDEDGITNRQRMSLGLAPLDAKTGKPLELHHLGQKQDSPLVELTEEEHRTGDYKDGKKNQSLWHDNAKETEVHGEGNNWNGERKSHWNVRVNDEKGK